MNTAISIFPLGDSAITIDLGNCIDDQLNKHALEIAQRLRAAKLPGISDILTAYSSVSVFYDPFQVSQSMHIGPQGVFSFLREKIEAVCKAARAFTGKEDGPASAPLRIPVCYEEEYAPDLAGLATEKGLSPLELVTLHTARIYKVYMIGFLPGFPYMGTVDPALASARKIKPSPVLAGGVGIAGNQTGIYPVDSPGGWRIIGRTPIRLFDLHAANPIRLKAGDRVQFFQVSAAEFRESSSVPLSMSFKTFSDHCRM